MKKFVIPLICLALLCACALGESATGSPSAAASATVSVTPSPTPSPTPIPDGDAFVCDELSLNLPYGLALMDETALAGYEAAVQADYEDTARTLAVASNESGAMMMLAICETEDDCLTAASEASADILGEGASVTQLQFGDNSCAAFACSIQDREYRIYFFSNGAQLLCVGTSGLTDAQISASLESLKF